MESTTGYTFTPCVGYFTSPGIDTRSSSCVEAYVSQISRPVEASQALVSSSRLTIPSLPDGGRCCGQTSKMWSTVCSGAPHSQTVLSRQVEARDAVWIADEVVQSRRRSCQPIVFPAGPEPGLLRHAWGRQIAEKMGLLGDGAT